MRNTIIGIIIGIVFGVMAGATVITPGLDQARHAPSNNISIGTESLKLDQKNLQKPTADRVLKQGKSLRTVNLFAPKSTFSKDITSHLEKSLPITFYAPNTLVPVGDTIAAVKSGTVDAVFLAPDQWNSTSPVLQLFTAIPFGPNADELLAWFYHGDGKSLFEKEFNRQNVHGILCAALPPSGSGWYQSPVRNVKDLKGLNIRSRGHSARILEKMGANVKDLDAENILKAFKAGQLDGAEYGLPSVDLEMNFSRYARNYYFPGWQHPTNLLALVINTKTWKRLPARTKASIHETCGENVHYSLTYADAIQFESLKKMGLAGVQVRRWPKPILKALKTEWQQITRELVQQDPDFNTAWSSLHLFRRDYAIWHELSRP